LAGREFQDQWRYVQQFLIEMKSVCDARGARFVMALFPDRLVIEEALWQTMVTRYHLDPAAYDHDAPAQLLKTFCQQHGIPAVDLTPAFRRQGRQGGLYHLGDTHWNRAGNRLAADVIYDFLAGQKLVPAP